MHSIRPRWASQLCLKSSRFSAGSPFTSSNHRTSHIADSLLGTIKPASSSSIRTRHSSSAASPDKAFRHRLEEVRNACSDPYPRLPSDNRSLSCAAFRDRYSHLTSNQTVEDDTVVINGRIRAYRLAGSKLIFFDIFQDGHKVQVMCNIRKLDGVAPDAFKRFYRLLRRGDAFSVTGKPHRTGTGELTILATELPRLLSPCLHDVPVDAEEHETSPYPRHVQFLADQKSADIIRARSAIIQFLRQFFLDRSFMEVSTPIIGSIAGGAMARPFQTSATEFPDRQLSLRIAPELWLKRLVVGGFDKVFEIGPSFRNEGLDKTHNPEFTTCEFYHAYANLEDLMSITENLLSGMAAHIQEFDKNANFTTGIEDKIGRGLPDLTAPDALDQVNQLFRDLSLPIPKNPTLPRLLDELCSTYLEPECINPTFILNPQSQRVAARAELFIDGREIVNTYEEENSPFEQRRKFEDQVRYNKGTDEPAEIDESYLEALEWGLPSTGGWGCGIDRLCMLFTGAKRIGDVLPFGNLRAVTRRHDGLSRTTD
ncbi:putative lysyl-tRNA synthetase [Aspergillus novofumigatus IBT 16806]|uniref:lysine--tRNA ligase n=1 Tax=Aspergillus novofumigatus (strain IBT 16806) TaxID=1392255 RepID=A0A2I1BVV6_ASPN1|nr:putative lysyl-tRNA synthetase [Aspergillus novofumigatus IBT 16806]PKX89514.1 putative lysyl-tRNA synthetase [Aspergillus novofumigatus IBT 16806]